MRSLVLLLVSSVLVACAHAAPPAPSAPPPPDSRPCARIDRTLGVDTIAFGAVMKVQGSCSKVTPGVEAQLRAALVRQLADTGCFARVVDLQAPGGSPRVDLTLTATVAQLEACTYTAATAASEQAASVAFIGAFTFGAPVGGLLGSAVANQGRGGWAAAQLLGVQLHDGQRSLWRRGVVTVAVREAGMNGSDLSNEALVDRATLLVARDLGRKISRVSAGDSPYGVITLAPAGPEQRPQIAVIGGEAADEAQALDAIPPPLRTQLGRGYPLLWPADRFAATRDAPTGTSAVVALFVSMEDATDWILTRNPRVKGLRVLPVK